jgi:hypothetical protein
MILLELLGCKVTGVIFYSSIYNKFRSLFEGEESQLKRKLVDNLIQGLKERPQDFSYTEFNLIDSSTGAEYWIANGGYGMHIIHPQSRLKIDIGSSSSLTNFHGNRAYRAFLKLKKDRNFIALMKASLI